MQPSLITFSALIVAVLAYLLVPAAPGDPNDNEMSRDLFFIYSVNNVGYIDVCGCKHKKVRQGSLPRRASYLRQVRSRRDDLLLVDGGNTLFGSDDRKAKPHEKTQLKEKAKDGE